MENYLITIFNCMPQMLYGGRRSNARSTKKESYVKPIQTFKTEEREVTEIIIVKHQL